MTISPPLERLLRHVAGTFTVCVIVGFVLYLSRGRAFWMGMLYAFAIGCQISFYISLFQHLVARALQRRRPDDQALRFGWIGWGWITPGVFVGSVLGYSGGLLLGDWLTGQRSAYPWEQSSGAALITLVFVLLVSVIATAFFFSHFKLQALKLSEAQAGALAVEARLTLLQSQLEPHMLFNTLAHLRVLIKLRPDEATAMLDQLISYLRATLLASRAPSHALSEEFARLGDYLALMRIRMGERLQVELDLPTDLAALAVPPLLLQPLVENAIKHGLEPHVDGGRLRVTAARVGGQLRLEVSDSGAGLTQASALSDVGTGFGLSQLRERLIQRYRGAASFDLTPLAGGGSLARIQLPLSPP